MDAIAYLTIADVVQGDGRQVMLAEEISRAGGGVQLEAHLYELACGRQKLHLIWSKTYEGINN